MKRTAALVACLLVLFLGSPLLSLEDLPSPAAEGAATEIAAPSLTLPLVDNATQVEPVQCASSTSSILSTGMTAAECAEVFGCCVCRQRVPGMGCIDWQGC